MKITAEEITKEDIQQAVNNLQNTFDSIDSTTQDISDNLEYLIASKSDTKENKNEQETEQNNKEKITETKSNSEETEEEITITDIYTEVQTVNENIETTNNILYVSVFTNGLLVGILLFTIFWNRVFK